MLKKILASMTMLAAVTAFAAIDVNKGTAAELDGLKGVGPSMSKRIIEAREQGAFKNWTDFMTRVKGIKEKNAAKLSSEGMTVNGQAFDGAAAVKSESKMQAAKAK